MSKEKQNPCEAAWKNWSGMECECDTCFQMHTRTVKEKEAFSAGFRAGEEGKAEVLEALEEAVETIEILCGNRPHPTSKIMQTIAKHTAK